MLDAHMMGTGQTYEEVDGGLTHLPEMIARRNELFKISGIRGKYPQLFIDDQFAGSFDECNDLNEGGEFKELLHWRLSNPPKPESGTVIAAFYGAKYGGAGIQINMDQFKVSAER
jgi:hypothetical protein